MDFEYLALSGGGVKGVFSAGVVLALDDLGLLENIKGMVGTSIGALISALYILGFSGKEIATFACNMDFSKLVERADPIRFMSRGYMFKAKPLKEKLQEFVRLKTLDKNYTLGQLFQKTGKHLLIVAVCKEDGKLALMDHTTDEFSDLPVWKAIRMSMSIPLGFKPVFWKGKHYIDGACRLNYPIHIFPIEKTLGIRIGVRGHNTSTLPVSENKNDKNILKGLMHSVFSMFNLLIVIMNAISEEAEIQTLKGLKFREIDGMIDENVSTLSFNISSEKKIKMVMSGVAQTLKYVIDPKWKMVEA
jgi:predicted acylesterase/phospholipase RssA